MTGPSKLYISIRDEGWGLVHSNLHQMNYIDVHLLVKRFRQLKNLALKPCALAMHLFPSCQQQRTLACPCKQLWEQRLAIAKGYARQTGTSAVNAGKG